VQEQEIHLVPAPAHCPCSLSSVSMTIALTTERAGRYNQPRLGIA